MALSSRDMIAYGESCLSNGDLGGSIEWYTAAKKAAEEEGDPSAQFLAMYRLGSCMIAANPRKPDNTSSNSAGWSSGCKEMEQALDFGLGIVVNSSDQKAAEGAKAMLRDLGRHLLELCEKGKLADDVAAVQHQLDILSLSTPFPPLPAESPAKCGTCDTSSAVVKGSIESDGVWYCQPCIDAYEGEEEEGEEQEGEEEVVPACGTCGVSSSIAAGCVEEDGVWYCEPCILEFTALNGNPFCGTCGVGKDGTPGQVEEDGVWYCSPCIAEYNAAVIEEAKHAVPPTPPPTPTCANCGDSTVPIALDILANLPYCEACSEERLAEESAARGGALLYSHQRLRSLRNAASFTSRPSGLPEYTITEKAPSNPPRQAKGPKNSHAGEKPKHTPKRRNEGGNSTENRNWRSSANGKAKEGARSDSSLQESVGTAAGAVLKSEQNDIAKDSISNTGDQVEVSVESDVASHGNNKSVVDTPPLPSEKVEQMEKLAAVQQPAEKAPPLPEEAQQAIRDENVSVNNEAIA